MFETAHAALFESAPTIQEILIRVLDFLLSIFAVLAIISAVVAGILYMKSAGSEKDLETAKRATRYVLIGILVGLGVLVIVKQIVGFFG